MSGRVIKSLIIISLALVAAGGLWVRRGALPEEPSQDSDQPRPQPPIADAPTETARETSRLFVLAINGGGSPGQNYKSHLLHLQGLVDLLHTSGVPGERITVFAGDGDDPSPDLVERAVDLGPEDWRLFGTDAEEYFSHLGLMGNSAVTGATLYPATRGSLSIWLMAVGQQLRAGDTLLLYVTDHGTSGAEPEGNRIVLWGTGQSLSVRELRDVLETLDPEVRVVALMSQCYSGGFAKLVGLGGDGEPTGRFCGFFSTTADRKAYGCYAETQDNPRVGHSFAFLQALPAAVGRLSVAHELAQEFDDTPDVPVRTSDLYLGGILAEAARNRRIPVPQFVDGLLHAAWAKTSAFNLQAQRLDRLGERFGLPTIRSRADVAKAAARVQKVSQELEQLAAALDRTLAEANQSEFRRFLGLRSDWKLTLDPAMLKKMDLERRLRVGKNLLYDLATFSGGQVPSVKSDRDATKGILFRMRVRGAAIARMESVLDAIAGGLYLDEHPEQRGAVQRLVDCEALDLKVPGAEWVLPGPALPPLDEDLARWQTILVRASAGGLVKQPEVRLAESAPQLQLVPYRGEIPNLASGKPLLLFFWATWCKACKPMVPALLAWASKQNVTILAVTDEDAATLDQFFAIQREFPSLVSRDPGQQTMSRFGVRNLPSLLLLDGRGRVASAMTSSLRELPTEINKESFR
jgi:thiol-disulfide isomerase/thioredoxin